MAYDIERRRGDTRSQVGHRYEDRGSGGGGLHPIAIALGLAAAVMVAVNMKDVIRYIKISNM